MFRAIYYEMQSSTDWYLCNMSIRSEYIGTLFTKVDH